MQMFWSSQYILNYSNLFFLSEMAASFHVVSERWILIQILIQKGVGHKRQVKHLQFFSLTCFHDISSLASSRNFPGIHLQRSTSFFIFLIPCFNFKVQRDKELFVLNCPPHDSKLSEIDYDDRSEEEQHRNNNFLQPFCQKNIKTKKVRKSGYAKAEVPLPKNLRRGNRGYRRSGGFTSAVATATAEVEVPLLRRLQKFVSV